MIGIIEADNSYDTVWGVGTYGLGKIAGVEYSPFHDGAWWRRWWERNKGKYADRVDDLTIPDFVKTEHGKNYVPFPEKVDTDEGKIELIVEEWKDYVAGEGNIKTISNLAKELGEARVERAIPVLIGIVDADNSMETRYVTGSLKVLTGVPFGGLTDGPFWRRWWQRSKGDYSLVGQDAEIPDLPRTEHGKSYIPYPDLIDTIEGRIELLGQLWKDHVGGVDNMREIRRLAWEFGSLEETRAIPTLIAIMEADNSYRIRREVGRGLEEITEATHHTFKDSRAWLARWEENGLTFAPGLASYEIPDLPKTEFGKNFEPFPDDIDRLDVKIRWIRRQMRRGLPIDLGAYADAMTQMHPEVETISFLIGLHRSLDPQSDAATTVDRFAITELVGHHVKRRDDESWGQWWRANGAEFSKDPNDLVVPDLSEEVRVWTAANAVANGQRKDAEFGGIPATEHHANGDTKMKYFQIGPRTDTQVPENGWKVLLILPGGAGDEDFKAFCRRIHQNALGKDYVALELVAHAWSDDENRTVWPTQQLRPDNATFTTEQFISAVVDDAAKRIKVDREYVFAMGWSSGGPAVYAQSLVENTPVTGSFVAMSVFRSQWMGDPKGAKGKPYFILHSPQDFINIDLHASRAAKELGQHGATVKLQTYHGGHGWRGNIYGNIASGVEWLEDQMRIGAEAAP